MKKSTLHMRLANKSDHMDHAMKGNRKSNQTKNKKKISPVVDKYFQQDSDPLLSYEDTTQTFSFDHGNNFTSSPSSPSSQYEQYEQSLPAVQQESKLLISREVYDTYYNTIDKKYHDFDMERIISNKLSMLFWKKSECSTGTNDRRDDNNEEQGLQTFIGGGSDLTWRQFSDKMQKFCAEQKLVQKQQQAMIELLHELFPDCKFPVRKTDKGSLVSLLGECASTTNDDAVLSFDCCPNGDHVYAGSFASQDQCPNVNCKHLRYTPCAQCLYLSTDSSCTHGRRYRTPYKISQYRPIATIINDILDSPNAGILLNYGDLDAQSDKYHDILPIEPQAKHRKSMETIYTSWCQAQEKKDNKRQQSRVELRDSNMKQSVTMMNILISCGYDGVKYFAKKTTKVEPLVISILNFPPPLRKTYGLGVHTLGIFNELVTKEQKKERDKNMSEVEQFLIRKCFVEELILLSKGVVIKTAQHGDVFLQVRLVNHNYDTPALQSVFRVQCNQSYAACPFCDTVDGMMKKLAGSCIYIGCRCVLPLQHVSRYKGQSKNLSPKHFYAKGFNHDKEFKTPPPWAEHGEAQALHSLEDINNLTLNFANHHIIDDDDDDDDDDDLPIKVDNNIDKDFEEVTGEPTANGLLRIKSLLSQIFHEKIIAVWFHDDICNFSDFTDISFAHHCDYRMKTYRRKNNQDYLRNAILYIVENEGKVKKEAVNGSYGLTEFAALDYFDFSEQAMFDAFHTLMNVCYEILQILRGEEANDAKTAAYCKFFGFHPNMHPPSTNETTLEEKEETTLEENNKLLNNGIDANTKMKKPTANINNSHQKHPTNNNNRHQKHPHKPPFFTLKLSEQRKVESWVDALLIPKGNANKYKINKLFSATGNLNGMSKIFVVSTLMELMITALFLDEGNNKCTVPHGYISYLRVFSDVISKLLEPQFSEDEIDTLFNRVAEFISLNELVLPHTSSKMVFHQLLDMPHHIRKMGPLRNFWSLYVERAIGQIKQTGVKKGSKFYQATFENAVMRERTILKSHLHEFGKKDTLHDLPQRMQVEGLLYSDSEEFKSATLSNDDKQKEHFVDTPPHLVYSDKFTYPVKRSHYATVKLIDMNPYEQIHMLEAILDIVHIKFPTKLERITNSLTHRLQDYFHCWLTKKHSTSSNGRGMIRKHEGDVDFVGFLYRLTADTADSSLSNADKVAVISNMGFTVIEELNPENYMRDKTSYFLKSDIFDLQHWMTDISFSLYDRAFVLGTQLRARGNQYRETTNPEQNDDEDGDIIMPGNHLNRTDNMRSLLFNKNMYSSWCKFRLQERGRGVRTTTKNTYAQLNAFYHVSSTHSSEKCIRNEMVASVCARKTYWSPNVKSNPTVSRLGIVTISDDDCSYDDTRIFVSVRFIYSSPIAVVPLNREKIPITKHLYDANDGAADKYVLCTLLFVDLEPSRMKLRMQ